MSDTSGRDVIGGPPQGGADRADDAVRDAKTDGGPARCLSRLGAGGDISRIAAALVISAACCPASASPADEAVRSLAVTGKLAEFRRSCPDESIEAVPTPIKLGPGTTAVVVKLTSSKGQCFGQPGENGYLLVHEASGWHEILSAEPGSIAVGRPDARGFAPVTLFGLGMCRIVYRRIVYRRSGSAYRASASKECHGLGGSPGLLDVRRAIED